MVVTVTTFDPTLEEDALSTARAFANTLTFVRADEDDENSR